MFERVFRRVFCITERGGEDAARLVQTLPDRVQIVADDEILATGSVSHLGKYWNGAI